ncbi:MAG: hypothetical protein HND55_06340 [Pseudomonadota bacterium]|nr:MAG: hypothetical protein HND55_06340 [Pseudomonadota bacterium]
MTETLPGDRIYSFPGGLKLRHNKQVACRQPIAEPDLPERLYVQVVQHQGSAGDICVEPGDRVAKGQRLTAAGDDLTVPEHAPTSGRVVAIADHPAAFPPAPASAASSSNPTARTAGASGSRSKIIAAAAPMTSSTICMRTAWPALAAQCFQPRPSSGVTGPVSTP